MGKIKIENIGDATFKMSGKAFLKGQYVIEYLDFGTDDSGNLITPEKISVLLRPASNNQPQKEGIFPFKFPILWSNFIDSSNNPYPDFETFSVALATAVASSGSIASVIWGSITGTLSDQTDLQIALDAKVDENPAITGATKTKITYDTKGLVTAGADATTSDIADSANKRYVTDAQLVVLGNTTNVNSGNDATNSQYSGLATSKEDTANKTDVMAGNIASSIKFLSTKGIFDYIVSLGYATTAYVTSALASFKTDNFLDATSSVQTQIDSKVAKNANIVSATKTKITYDSKGLVTAGTDATTTDITEVANKRYVTDANLVILGNTSGTNTGDNATNTQYSGLASNKEDSANKSTLTSDSASSIKFPVWSAVVSYVTSAISGFVSKASNLSDLISVKIARVNLGIDSITNIGDSNYTILSTDKTVATSVAFTAPRTWTLPSPSSANAGYEIIVSDLFGSVSNTNTLTVLGAINGGSSVVIGAQFGARRITSDGVSKWTVDAGVMRVSDYIGTALTASKVVVTDANSKLTNSTVSTTALGFLDATSSVQTQLNNRLKLVIKDATDSATITSSVANTILKSWFIPANTFSTSDLMFVYGLDMIMTGANSARTLRMYVNTTNTIPATAIAQVSVTSANIYTADVSRKFVIKGGNIEFPTIAAYTSAPDSGNSSSATRQTVAFNPAIDNYFIIAGQLSSSLDTLFITGGQMTN